MEPAFDSPAQADAAFDQSYEERMAARAERRKQREGGAAPSAAAASPATTAPLSSRASVAVSNPSAYAAQKKEEPERKPVAPSKPAEAGGSSAPSKRMTFVVVSEKCDVCEKTVYPLEKIEADGKKYHKTCFKCEQCKKTLSLGNFAALSGKFYCKPHFKQLFRLKGNYDEGFGRTMRKHDWVQKQDGQPAGSGESHHEAEDDRHTQHQQPIENTRQEQPMEEDIPADE